MEEPFGNVPLAAPPPSSRWQRLGEGLVSRGFFSVCLAVGAGLGVGIVA